MKRIFALALTLMLAALLLTSAAFAASNGAAGVTISIADAAMNETGEVTFTVEVTQSPGMLVMVTSLTCGDGIESFEVTNGGLFSGLTHETGLVWDSSASVETGTLATIKVKVKDGATAGTGTVTLTVLEVTSKDSVNIIDAGDESIGGSFSVTANITGLPCDHSYTESVVKSEALKSAANCQSAAVYYKSCSVCGAVSTSDTDTFTSGEKDTTKHTGTLSDWLTDAENTKHWKEYSCCHAHANEAAHASTSTNAATCTKKAVCDDCGKSYGDKADHSYTAEVEKLEALKTAGDCLTEAVYYKSCSACGAVSTSDTDTFNGAKDPTNHAATCEVGDEWLTDEANTKHWKERTCGAKAEEAAHKSTGDNVATCQQVAICDDCGKDYGDKTAHGNWGDDYKVVTEPTCGKDGVAEGTCGYCQQMIKDIVLPATGEHTWDEGKVTKEATATAEGEKTYTCSVCGQTKTEAIAKLQPSGGKNAPKAGTPKTGDESHLVLWAVVLLAACGGGTALVIRSRKKEN